MHHKTPDYPTPAEIIDFARAWIVRVLGKDTILGHLNFFLAGGIYKSLIHHRPPRDLDIWCEDDLSREALLQILNTRGKELQAAPGAQRFCIDELQVDVSFQIESMESRLKRFDLGLACIAVAFRKGRWIPYVHPLFYRSLLEQRLFLIQCHHNLALASLVRTRRYALDMGYERVQPIEKELWSLHYNLMAVPRL